MTEIDEELEMELRNRITILELTTDRHESAIVTLALSIMCIAAALLIFRSRLIK